MYLNTIGDYNVDDIGKFNDIQTCVSKDLRPGFEGHDVVEVSWKTHSTHGMYMYVLRLVINKLASELLSSRLVVVS